MQGRSEEAGIDPAVGPADASLEPADGSLVPADPSLQPADASLVQTDPPQEPEDHLQAAPHEEQPIPVLGGGQPVLSDQDEYSVEIPNGVERIPDRPIDDSVEESVPLAEGDAAEVETFLGLEDAEDSRRETAANLQTVEAGNSREEGGSSTRHRVASEAEGPRTERSAGSEDVRSDETAEDGAALEEGAAEEGGSEKGESHDSSPRTMPSRAVIPKGMEQAGERLAGEVKPLGQTPAGETSGSLAGKEAASWRQEVQVEPATKPPPSPVASQQAMPNNSTQASSGSAFRIQGDTVHMRIQDEELGPMRWHIHMNSGRITAEAIVETSRVQELLQYHQDVLQAKLNALGDEMEAFDVSVDQGSQKFETFSGLKGSGQHGRSTGNSEEAPDSKPVVWNVTGGSESGLDLYV